MASNQIFVSPYNQKAQIWQTQGAKIYCIQAGSTFNASGSSAPSALLCLTAFRATLQRQVQDRYPLGGGGIIRLVGQPRGQMQIQSLLGPKNDVAKFIGDISSICKPVDLVVMPFALSALSCGNDNTNDVSWRFTNCTAMNVTFDIQQAQGGLSLVTIPIVARFDNVIIAGAAVKDRENSQA